MEVLKIQHIPDIGNGGRYQDLCDETGIVRLVVDMKTPSSDGSSLDGYTGTTINISKSFQWLESYLQNL